MMTEQTETFGDLCCKFLDQCTAIFVKCSCKILLPLSIVGLLLGLNITSLWAIGPASDPCLPTPSALPHLTFRAYFMVFGLSPYFASGVVGMLLLLSRCCNNNEESGSSPACGKCLFNVAVVLGVQAALLYAIWVILAIFMWIDVLGATGVTSCTALQQLRAVFAAIWIGHVSLLTVIFLLWACNKQ